MKNDNDLNLHSMTKLSGWLRYWSYVFPDKNQKLLRMSRMRITKQAVAILSLIISGNETKLLKSATDSTCPKTVEIICP